MRATHCCLLAMLGLLGCGGTLISSDGGEEDAAMGDEEPLSVLDAGGSGDATGPAGRLLRDQDVRRALSLWSGTDMRRGRRVQLL
jgi:hypothetical protein